MSSSIPEPLASSILLDSFRRDRARGLNDDIDLTLRPAYRALLTKLGNPQQKLPQVFHVAGTNGKGSTCAFLRAILEAAGYRVHVYTSPHLVRFHERIRIAGQLITEDELVELLKQCQKFSGAGEVTYFEAATAVAFAGFARHPADFTILEVGLGGRLDATNIIPASIAAIITRLSFDHRDYLGPTMQDIAREKAGIMREGVPCFTAQQPDAGALQTLRDEATRLHAPLFVAGKDWQIEKTESGFRYRDPKHAFDLPAPGLAGEHQYGNAGLAIAALLGIQNSGFSIKVTPDYIAKGLQNVAWPARLQHLTQGRLADLLHSASELWLDGGHNDSAGEALAKQAEIWKAKDPRPLHLICGMLTTKKPGEFLEPLAPYATSLLAVPIPGEAASFASGDLAEAARAAGIHNAQSAAGVATAIRSLASSSQQPMRILICGSLYLAGDTLKQNTASQE